MRRKAGLLAALAGIILLQACLKDVESEADKKAKENEQQIQKFLADSSYTAQKTATGLYYFKTVENPTGREPELGNIVYVHYEERRLSDNFLIDKSGRVNNHPAIFPLNISSSPRGFYEGVSLLKEGEKAKLIVPSHLAYGALSSSTIPPYSVLKYDVALVKVRTQGEALLVFATDSLQLKPEDGQAVSEAPGTYYFQTQAGTGAELQNGKAVTVRYRGRFINGVRFAPSPNSPDQFEENQFILGQDQRIKGFEEGVKRMKVGEKGILFIPAPQAYGEEGISSQGRWIIPPYSPLVFDVEIVAATS